MVTSGYPFQNRSNSIRIIPDVGCLYKAALIHKLLKIPAFSSCF